MFVQILSSTAGERLNFQDMGQNIISQFSRGGKKKANASENTVNGETVNIAHYAVYIIAFSTYKK